MALLVSTGVPGGPYCAYGNHMCNGQARSVVSDGTAGEATRPIAKVAMPTFWDGVAQAFDIHGQHPPCDVFDEKAPNLYATVLGHWLRYGARGNHIAARHIQGISE